ncbi:hypothetical protein BA894_23480 [Vibrio natriegens]|uniref:hypothetical protein n=1 Tax=Vibrio natriegens TaxID=691 RepID=UPI000803EACE|nr:hypothetical protein [Vibrio natriegens]ANQ29344.1 hypothetical protein BA894_23480 [Vibrio natriegens]
MNPTQLSRFPKLKSVISKNLEQMIIDIYYEHRTDKRVDASLNIYRVFIDITRELDSGNNQYSGLDVLNDKNLLQEQYILVMGFIYEVFKETFSIKSLYSYAKNFRAIFEGIAEHQKFEIISLHIGYDYVSKDIENCVGAYKQIKINKRRLNYYKGWTCYSKDNKPKAAHISIVFEAYGESFGNKVFIALKSFSMTQTTETLEGVIRRISRLFEEFTCHCETENELYIAMSSENSVEFMLDVMNSMVNKALIKDLDPYTIFREWERGIKDFTECFIDTGFFDEPLVPFVTPRFKLTQEKKYGISVGGKLTKISTTRYFDWIPLKIKDQEAIKLIKEKIERDIEYVHSVAENIVKNAKSKHERNIKILNNEEVEKKVNVKTIDAIKNFHTLGFCYRKNKYHDLLGFGGNFKELLEEVNLPSLDTMFAIMYLLVIEHPLITPSWLFNWEMYDTSGNQVGFRKSGKSWVIISSKPRKGADYAQQEVILNDFSKSLVEFLIKYTKFSRNYLKSINNPNWRYTILKANLTNVARINKLTSTARDRQKLFYNKLISPQNMKKFGKDMSTKEIEELSNDISLRNIRKSLGIKIYLNTHSFQSVTKSLGHKKNTTSSLDSYLPQPLVDYFNERWVRIFQNAILFEALKESDNLMYALDFDERSLDEFLNNHRLGELPKFMDLAKSSPINEQSQRQIESINAVKFIISVPLLQVLIALKSTVETVGQGHSLPIVEKWYESAIFILSHFELENNTRNASLRKLIPLYNIAKENPLDETNFIRSFVKS